MSKRFTITEKWEDSWFWQLNPQEKLLFNYLCDKCDLAGFWEVNLDLASFQTKIPKKAILGAVQGLKRGYLTNGKYLWLRTFIRHQGNFPLNPENNAHKHIIGILERHNDFGINFIEELNKIETPLLGAKEGLKEGLLSPPSKGKGKGKGIVKVKVNKEKYLDFVFLSKTEHQKLIDKFGKQQTTERIAALNDGIGSKGYKYDSHYHTILNWARKDAKDNANTGKSRRNLSEPPASAYGETIET